MSQIVIITGGAQGIGFGIARCFARRGATIVLADMKAEQAQESAEKLQSEGAPQAVGIGCDITQREQVEAMSAQVVQQFGRIDVLVNNAGICPFVHIMEMKPEMFSKVIEVNLTGAFHCTQVVGRHMIERAQNGDAGGSVVFITSLSDRFIGPNQVEYAASKSGLRMLMCGFATALGPHGVTCNAVAPGMISTELTGYYWDSPDGSEKIKTLAPIGRGGTPEDIGNAVVFLASPEASYISGETITVDGGFSAQIK